jgi:asparagine synthase (glutamine-hydrolysing)
MSVDNRVGLAHRRLSIIDLSDMGAQPMATADNRLHVVFNGEIYNYRELSAALETKGYRFRSTSDTEVLLHLYAEYGADMVHHLQGMFAFAIWDEKRHVLFLARDPFGIKPLYYADDGKTFRFASQVKALLEGGQVSLTPEPAGHVGFFLWGSVPEPYTLYKGVRSLPAGSSLLIDGSHRHESKVFFRLATTLEAGKEHAEEIAGNDTSEYLRDAVRESVHQHLVADVPVGVFLSSGLDSTTLAALVAEIAPASLKTVTLGFNEYKGTPNDETRLAEQVANRYGASHTTKWISRVTFQEKLPNLLAAMDQPSIDGVNTYFVSMVTAQTGLKVALSGLGGDELFAGYPSFREIPRTVRALSPLRSVPFLGKGFRMITGSLLKRFTSPKYAGLLEYGSSYGGAYLLRRGLFMPWELPNMMDPDMAREGWRELQPLIRLEETIKGVSNDRLRVSALEMAWYMRNQLLRDADWASMAHSLEIRVPFLDIKLLRKLAPLFWLDTPPTKRDMALAPARALPPEVLNRPKTGFSIPVREWMMETLGKHTAARGLRGWATKVHGAIA